MKYVKTRIVNCKSASIRLAPWDAERSKEIVGIRDGPHEEDGSVTAGTVIDINPQEIPSMRSCNIPLPAFVCRLPFYI